MKRVCRVCPKCFGKGYYKRYNWLLGGLTGGLTLLMDASSRWECGLCKGHGVIEIEGGGEK